MNILVISKISIPAKDRTLPAWEHLRGLGHTVIVEHPEKVGPILTGRFDAMISMGVSVMDETFAALERFPGTPLFCYNWDCYEWVWTNPRSGEYDYRRYGDLLRLAKEVWVPSSCTGRCNERWWGVKHNHVVLSSCPWWEAKPDELKDGGYALCTLRHLPDKWDTKFEECCADLGIPFVRTDHNLSRPDYEKTVAGCRFMVNHYLEASTGGLTLMEAYHHGKPCLCSDSPWNGARDYFGDRAVYFDHASEDDFRAKLIRMHANPPRPDPAEARRWIEDNYSDQVMVEKMLGRMQA